MLQCVFGALLRQNEPYYHPLCSRKRYLPRHHGPEAAGLTPNSRVVLPPLAVTSCFMLPEHGPGCNFFSPIAITAGSFGALFDVLVLTLFFGTHAA